MEMTALLPALGVLVLERLAGGRFRAPCGVPGWCRALRPALDWDDPISIEDPFPFLKVFLLSAERAWTTESPIRVDSDLWTVAALDGSGDIHLVASAVNVSGAHALVVVRSDALFLQSQSLLQRARELRFVHTSLTREMEQKDILVHAIVHDLVAPLHSILGVLSLLGERTHEEPQAGWLRLAIAAARRQQELIGEILDVFTAEVAALEQVGPEGVELAGVLDGVMRERQPVARSHNVALELEAGVSRTFVVGEETRLFRVLTNLVDNALRFSPAGGTVHVAVRVDDAFVTVSVDDEGPGVSPEVLPHLFEKLGHGRDRGSGAGLGLFFCRMTMENWGGAVGYERRPAGGSKFWVRLKAMQGPAGRLPQVGSRDLSTAPQKKGASRRRCTSIAGRRLGCGRSPPKTIT